MSSYTRVFLRDNWVKLLVYGSAVAILWWLAFASETSASWLMRVACTSFATLVYVYWVRYEWADQKMAFAADALHGTAPLSAEESARVVDDAVAMTNAAATMRKRHHAAAAETVAAAPVQPPTPK
jgi:hypothetical protein